MTNIDVAQVLANEIAAHQFGDTVQPPGTLLQAFQAATSPKQWSPEFGVYLCPCNRKGLPLLQIVHLIRGDIDNSIDMWQGNYHPGVGASAGSHDKGGPVDIGQMNDRCLKTQRECGFGANHRLTSQGFAVEHNHMFPIGCNDGSPLAMWQQREWQAGRNGLVSQAPITGPGPIGKDTPHWTEGVKLMEAEISAFEDRLVARLKAELLPAINRNATPSETINWAGINVASSGKPMNWSAGHVLSWLVRVAGPMNNKVNGLDAKVNGLAANIATLTALVQKDVSK